MCVTNCVRADSRFVIDVSPRLPTHNFSSSSKPPTLFPNLFVVDQTENGRQLFSTEKKTIFPSLLIQLRISTRVPISLVDMATHMQMSPYISCKFPHCHLATACYISLLFFRLRKESMKVVGRIVTMATRVALSESLYRRKHAHHCDYVALIRVCFFESI